MRTLPTTPLLELKINFNINKAEGARFGRRALRVREIHTRLLLARDAHHLFDDAYELRGRVSAREHRLSLSGSAA
jgi:hypothetical protein